jgi:DNA-binding HxlR family transcriptional regulator
MKLEKVTEVETRVRRRYEDACGTAHALDLIGERWALLVMRELMFGPKRFSDLRSDLPGISANVLTQRLEGLEAAGVLVRRKLPPPASTQVYELTPWGYESEPIFQALGRWAVRSPEHDPRLPLSSASLLLSFKTMFDPERARGISGRIGFQLGRESFVVTVKDGSLNVERGLADGVDLLIAGSPSLVAAAVYGQPLAELESAGALSVEGDRELAELFLKLFPLPPKIASESSAP